MSEDGNSVSFRLTGLARAEGAGSAVELLGGAALADGVSGDGWHVALRKKDEHWVYDLVAERGGGFFVDVSFEVKVSRKGDWRILGFNLPAGVVVPVMIDGLGGDVGFDKGLAVVPQFHDKQWRGFLPASGSGAMAWRVADKVADGTLFFSSTETTDVRVGSGLLRQLTVLDLRVLQGKISELNLSLNGPGEILSVDGDPVLGWVVRDTDGKRELHVDLNRPIEGSGRIVIEAQAALGGFPVKAEALRISPVGALRHSGWLRVANDGAVRVEVADAKGLIQLAPEQFPGGVNEKLRQVFVYRFPSAEYSYAVNATQVLPEVRLSNGSHGLRNRRDRPPDHRGSRTGHPRSAAAQVGVGNSRRPCGGLGDSRGSGGLCGGGRGAGREADAQDPIQTGGCKPAVGQREIGEERGGQARPVGASAARFSPV